MSPLPARRHSIRVVRSAIFAAVGGLVSLFAGGCNLFLRATPTPLPTQTTRISDAAPRETLVVFLPGRGGSMNDFRDEGLLKIMNEAGVRADVVSVDAHLGYYYRRTVIDRLKADVFIPARAQGYRRVVLVGLSLGGLGSLLTERDQPGSADALVLLAPYLGDKSTLFAQIESAGGPAAWSKANAPRLGVIEEELWSYIGARHADLPHTWLLYGRQDSLAPGHRLFATLLPDDHVIAIDGAHDWKTWRVLWKSVCEHSELFTAEKAN